jgi:hypothetical protein
LGERGWGYYGSVGIDTLPFYFTNKRFMKWDTYVDLSKRFVKRPLNTGYNNNSFWKWLLATILTASAGYIIRHFIK